MTKRMLPAGSPVRPRPRSSVSVSCTVGAPPPAGTVTPVTVTLIFSAEVTGTPLFGPGGPGGPGCPAGPAAPGAPSSPEHAQSSEPAIIKAANRRLPPPRMFIVVPLVGRPWLVLVRQGFRLVTTITNTYRKSHYGKYLSGCGASTHILRASHVAQTTSAGYLTRPTKVAGNLNTGLT